MVHFGPAINQLLAGHSSLLLLFFWKLVRNTANMSRLIFQQGKHNQSKSYSTCRSWQCPSSDDMKNLQIIYFFNKSLASYLNSRHVQTADGMWKSDICANTFLHFWPPYPRAMLSFVSAASFKTWSMRAFLLLLSSIRTGLASGRFWKIRSRDGSGHNSDQLFTTLHYNICCYLKTSYYFIIFYTDVWSMGIQQQLM